jgi:hypothetical protein
LSNDLKWEKRGTWEKKVARKNWKLVEGEQEGSFIRIEKTFQKLTNVI